MRDAERVAGLLEVEQASQMARRIAVFQEEVAPQRHRGAAKKRVRKKGEKSKKGRRHKKASRK
jgi:hypothetical protein